MLNFPSILKHRRLSQEEFGSNLSLAQYFSKSGVIRAELVDFKGKKHGFDGKWKHQVSFPSEKVFNCKGEDLEIKVEVLTLLKFSGSPKTWWPFFAVRFIHRNKVRTLQKVPGNFRAVFKKSPNDGRRQKSSPDDTFPGANVFVLSPYCEMLSRTSAMLHCSCQDTEREILYNPGRYQG